MHDENLTAICDRTRKKQPSRNFDWGQLSWAGNRLWNLCYLISKRVLYLLLIAMRGNPFHEISSSEINVNKLNLCLRTGCLQSERARGVFREQTKPVYEPVSIGTALSADCQIQLRANFYLNSKQMLYFLVRVMRGNPFHEISSSLFTFVRV